MKRNTGASEAIELLKQDHRDVEALFSRFEKSEEGSVESLALCREITIALAVHAMVEEEMMYPAARASLGEEAKSLLDEAAVEHASLKKMLIDLSNCTPEDYFFRAKVKVLSEYVEHHVREEEDELMPMLEESAALPDDFAERLMERKQALTSVYATHFTGGEDA